MGNSHFIDIYGKGLMILKKDFRAEGVSPITPVESKTTYALVCDSAKLLDGRVVQKTEEQKLQSGARRVLAILAVRDGVSQLDLIRATHLKAPTISLIVQKMEHDGLILRKTDDLDMRLTRVFLTERGKAVNHEIHDTIRDVEDIAMNGFTDAEKEQLHSLLVRLYRNMEDIKSN